MPLDLLVQINKVSSGVFLFFFFFSAFESAIEFLN